MDTQSGHVEKFFTTAQIHFTSAITYSPLTRIQYASASVHGMLQNHCIRVTVGKTHKSLDHDKSTEPGKYP